MGQHSPPRNVQVDTKLLKEHGAKKLESLHSDISFLPYLHFNMILVTLGNFGPEKMSTQEKLGAARTEQIILEVPSSSGHCLPLRMFWEQSEGLYFVQALHHTPFRYMHSTRVT